MAQDLPSDTGPEQPSLAARDPSRPYSPTGSTHSESPVGGQASRAAAAAYAATPGINLTTYHSPQPDTEDHDVGGYFSRNPSVVASSHHLSQASLLAQSSASRAASGTDLLKRATTARMGHNETLDEIRAANPDLTVSGNIISATFNMPHSFNYRKGSDWVRPVSRTAPPRKLICPVPPSSQQASELPSCLPAYPPHRNPSVLFFATPLLTSYAISRRTGNANPPWPICPV